MTISGKILGELSTFEILRGESRGDGTSFFILGRRKGGFSEEDGFDAAEALEAMRLKFERRQAELDPQVRSRRAAIQSQFRRIFEAAGLTAIYMEEIENEYWPKAYQTRIFESPWYMVTTPFGHFKIGWRKSVLEIDWERTRIVRDGQVIFADERVTCGPRMIHAWSEAKAVEYIQKLTA